MTVYYDEFSAAILESMDDAIRSLLSQDVLDAFRSNLAEKQSISPEEIPNQLPTVSIVLKKYFGQSADVIEREIAQRLYERYGLEFQKNGNFQLTDYVKNAKGKLKPVTPTLEPPTMNLPMRGDFDRLFLESVREAIEESVGRDKAKVAFQFLERDAPFDKLQHHMPTFYMALKKNFGRESLKIETAIARKLYQKLSLEFIETPNTELVRYVELAVVKLGQRERLGFVDLLGKH